MITAFGETKSSRKWAEDERCLPRKSLLDNRMNDGWRPEEAITTPVNVGVSIEVQLEMVKDNDRFNDWLDKNSNATREQKRKRAHFLLNEERARESSKKWSHANRSEVTARNRKWRRANPDRRRFHESARERRLHNTPIHLLPTNAQLAEWKELYGQRCCYCESTENLTLEHIVPISKGGFHTLENILWACRSCNSSKKDETFIIWLWKKCNKSISMQHN